MRPYDRCIQVREKRSIDTEHGIVAYIHPDRVAGCIAICLAL